MKKYIFLFLVLFLIILILIYFYDKRELVLNRIYSDNNIYIEYPYFNNKNIDRYIDNYLNSIINNNDNSNYFVDYDYIIDDNNINLTIYSYKLYDNIIKKNINNYSISIDDNSINRVDYSINNNYKYNLSVSDNNYKLALVFVGDVNNNTINILNILDKYNIKASFCLDNNNLEIKKIIERFNMDIINDCIINNSIKINDDINHSSSAISNKVLNNIKDGDIIVMHSIYSATSNSLELLIPSLINMGYRFVSLNDLNIL